MFAERFFFSSQYMIFFSLKITICFFSLFNYNNIQMHTNVCHSISIELNSLTSDIIHNIFKCEIDDRIWMSSFSRQTGYCSQPYQYDDFVECNYSAYTFSGMDLGQNHHLNYCHDRIESLDKL